MENKKEKPKVKKGLWKPDEDLILKTYIETHGEGKWATVSANSGLNRGGKSCRLRWKNYLRPDIKRGGMSQEEEDLIIRMHKLLGNRWSLIAGRLPGRTDNEVKNYWNTHFNKTHFCRKRKTIDSNYSNQKEKSNGDKKNSERMMCPASNSQPSCGTQSLETLIEETEVENEKRQENSTLAVNNWIWEPQQSMDYCIGTPTLSTNDENFVFKDDPFIVYFESFLLCESLDWVDEHFSLEETQKSQIRYF